MRIAIIAALPGELKPLVKGWQRQSGSARGLSVWKTERDGDEIIAVCGGMGAAAATRAFSAAEFFGPLDLVLSVGWAGALAPEMKAGESYVLSEIIDAKTGERYRLTEGKGTLRVVTTPAVADAAEKLRLYKSYGAVLVDMEAATVARLARMRDISVGCFKAVSDDVDAELPDLNPFIDADGQMRMPAFLAHVVLRPQTWAPLARLGRNSGVAAKNLASTIESFLREKNIERTNRTGAV